MQKFEYHLQKYAATGFLGGKVDLAEMDIEFNSPQLRQTSPPDDNDREKAVGGIVGCDSRIGNNMLNWKTFFIREHVGLIKLSST